MRSSTEVHQTSSPCAAALADLALLHVNQANESDVALLTRLGTRFDAVATAKAGSLLLSSIGAGTTSTGIALPRVSISRGDGDQHR